MVSRALISHIVLGCILLLCDVIGAPGVADGADGDSDGANARRRDEARSLGLCACPFDCLKQEGLDFHRITLTGEVHLIRPHFIISDLLSLKRLARSDLSSPYGFSPNNISEQVFLWPIIYYPKCWQYAALWYMKNTLRTSLPFQLRILYEQRLRSWIPFFCQVSIS